MFPYDKICFSNYKNNEWPKIWSYYTESRNVSQFDVSICAEEHNIIIKQIKDEEYRLKEQFEQKVEHDIEYNILISQYENMIDVQYDNVWQYRQPKQQELCYMLHSDDIKLTEITDLHNLQRVKRKQRKQRKQKDDNIMSISNLKKRKERLRKNNIKNQEKFCSGAWEKRKEQIWEEEIAITYSSKDLKKQVKVLNTNFLKCKILLFFKSLDEKIFVDYNSQEFDALHNLRIISRIIKLSKNGRNFDEKHLCTRKYKDAADFFEDLYENYLHFK